MVQVQQPRAGFRDERHPGSVQDVRGLVVGCSQLRRMLWLLVVPANLKSAEKKTAEICTAAELQLSAAALAEAKPNALCIPWYSCNDSISDKQTQSPIGIRVSKAIYPDFSLPSLRAN